MSHIVGFASDHAGVELKAALTAYASSLGYTVEDFGPQDTASVDYPDYAHTLSRWVSHRKDRLGVLICGSGIGMSIAANRHENIRAALCFNAELAQLSRQHNNANILCLGARFSDEPAAQLMLKRFLETEFEGGRHQRRVDKLMKPQAVE